jgi:hypothetical protein
MLMATDVCAEYASQTLKRCPAVSNGISTKASSAGKLKGLLSLKLLPVTWDITSRFITEQHIAVSQQVGVLSQTHQLRRTDFVDLVLMSILAGS